MAMTHKDAYAFGWVYGVLTAALRKVGKDSPYDQNWGARPFTCQAQITKMAQENHLLTPSVEAKIAPVLAGIEIKVPEGDGTEIFQPLPIQGSWQLGYYAGLGGTSFPADIPNLADRRKAAGMTQADLAAALGVDRSQVAHWERGVRVPQKYNAEIDRILQ